MAKVVEDGTRYGVNSNIFSRDRWMAQPPKEELPTAKHPFDAINLTLENEFGPCRTINECTAKVHTIQQYYLEKNFKDIPHNFLVGNDGYVYEGRGWNYRAEETTKAKLTDSTLDICLIGGSNGEKFTHADGMDQRVAVAKEFVLENIERNLILKDYDVTGYIRSEEDIDE